MARQDSKYVKGMNGVLKTANSHIRYLSEMEQDNVKPVLALSGGMDSLALAVLCLRYFNTMYAMHYDHDQGRHDTKCKKAFVNLCERLKVVSHLVTADGERLSKAMSFESEARKCRYKALYEYAKRLNPDSNHQHIVTAHHLDDQIEGILMGICRGVSVRITPMAKKTVFVRDNRSVTIHRPLLSCPRDTLTRFVRDNLEPCGIVRHAMWSHDSTNDDPSYERNFFRHAVIPILKGRRNILKTIPKSIGISEEVAITHENHLFWNCLSD